MHATLTPPSDTKTTEVSTTNRPTAAEPLLSINGTEFAECFNRKPFLIGHKLVGHPLFELDRLLQLSRDLAESDIEYNAGNVAVNQDAALTPRNGLDAAETVRRIQECKSWMVLKHVENDPAYKALLEECLAEVREHSEAIVPGMMHAHGYIFLTSPGSVTPYHMDPEHNFLLQVRGSKIIHMFDGNDPSIVSQTDLEQFYGGRVRNMTLTDENRPKAWIYNLEPGYGLHFPVTYPHFVQNCGEVSVSFSITFRSPDLDRRLGLHTVNRWMRSKGLKPAPLGRRPLVESLKYQGYRIARKLGWT